MKIMQDILTNRMTAALNLMNYGIFFLFQWGGGGYNRHILCIHVYIYMEQLPLHVAICFNRNCA